MQNDVFFLNRRKIGKAFEKIVRLGTVAHTKRRLGKTNRPYTNRGSCQTPSAQPKRSLRLTRKYVILVDATLKLAALPNKIPMDDVSCHSLRSGGATALFHVGVDMGAIQKWGRWNIQCFVRYIWISANGMRKLWGACCNAHH